MLRGASDEMWEDNYFNEWPAVCCRGPAFHERLKRQVGRSRFAAALPAYLAQLIASPTFMKRHCNIRVFTQTSPGRQPWGFLTKCKGDLSSLRTLGSRLLKLCPAIGEPRKYMGADDFDRGFRFNCTESASEGVSAFPASRFVVGIHCSPFAPAALDSQIAKLQESCMHHCVHATFIELEPHTNQLPMRQEVCWVSDGLFDQ